MAYVITENRLGQSLIGSVDTTAKVRVGTIVTAADPTYGAGEFIYLKGLDATVVGSWVTYNMDDGSTTLLAANAIGPVAVAMAATVTGTWGWYHIQGKAIANAADVADNADVYIDTVSGMCDDAAVTGDRVWGAKWASADDTASDTSQARAEVEIARPFVNDGLNAGTT
jgi:hypothetical protein